jgi:hypothetical protein
MLCVLPSRPDFYFLIRHRLLCHHASRRSLVTYCHYFLNNSDCETYLIIQHHQTLVFLFLLTGGSLTSMVSKRYYLATYIWWHYKYYITAISQMSALPLVSYKAQRDLAISSMLMQTLLHTMAISNFRSLQLIMVITNVNDLLHIDMLT